MADKRYYWLKMEENFFNDKRVKKLRKIAGGDTYTIIYLKMMLSSLETEGIITYEGIEDTLAEEIALDLDEDSDNVEVTIQFLLKSGLMEELDNNQYYLPAVVENLGSESDSAKRVRAYRERRKMQKSLQCNAGVTESLQCNADVTDGNEAVTNGNTDIDIDIDKDIYTTTTDKEIYSFGFNQHVRLSKDEMQNLQRTYGMERVYLAITRLDDYLHTKGIYYPSHFKILKQWIEEDSAPKNVNAS